MNTTKKPFQNLPPEVSPLWRELLDVTVVYGADSQEVASAMKTLFDVCGSKYPKLNVFLKNIVSRYPTDEVTRQVGRTQTVNEPQAPKTSRRPSIRKDESTVQGSEPSLDDTVGVIARWTQPTPTEEMRQKLKVLSEAVVPLLNGTYKNDPWILAGSLLKSSEGDVSTIAQQLGLETVRSVLLAAGIALPQIHILVPYRDGYGILAKVFDVEVELAIRAVHQHEFHLIPSSRASADYPIVTVDRNQKFRPVSQSSYEHLISEASHDR